MMSHKHFEKGENVTLKVIQDVMLAKVESKEGPQIEYLDPI